MYAVHYLSQYSVAPGEEHLTAMRHVYQYLDNQSTIAIMGKSIFHVIAKSNGPMGDQVTKHSEIFP